MPAYYVAHIKVTDPDAYSEVQKRFPALFEQYKARVLAADPRFEVLDGECDATRIVVLEFETTDELKRWYYSDEYQATVALRRKAAEADIVLVHGV